MSRAVAVLLLLPLGCDDHLLGHSADTPPCLTEPSLTWENFGQKTLKQYCVSCHSDLSEGTERNGAPDGVNFNTWDDAILWADRILVRVLEDSTMPPAQGMDDAEKGQLEEWLHCELLPASGQL
jgi:hypothetical protein